MGILVLLAGVVFSSSAPLKGQVGPGRGRSFFSARTVARIGVRYQRGRLRLLSLQIVHYEKQRRFRRFVGRFRVDGFCGRRRCFQQEFDLPGLGRTAGFTARDSDLLSKLAAGMTTQGTVTVPWPGCSVRLVVRDKVTRKSYVFPKPCRLLKKGRRRMGRRRPRS